MGARVFDAVARASVTRTDDRRLEVAVDLIGGPEGARAKAWSASVEREEDGEPVVDLERSPDRRRLAVLVGAALFDVDLTDLGGVHVGHDVIEAAPRSEAAVVWNGGRPQVVPLVDETRERLGLADGRVLVLDAPVFADAGFSGGDHGTSSTYRLPSDMSSPEGAAVRAAVQEELSERAAARRPTVCRVQGRHEPAVLLDGPALPAAVSRSVHWPVSVGPSGIVVRTSTTRTADDGGMSTRIDEPWFVARDGTVGRIPVRLGNAPLCELPDGRWLLFGSDPLWGDAGDEPLHAVGLDGTVTPWCPAGAPVTTTSVLSLVAPDLLPSAPPENPDEWPWATAARVSRDGAQITMLIADVPWEPRWDPTEDVGWALVRMSLCGEADPVLLARGRRSAARFETFAL